MGLSDESTQAFAGILYSYAPDLPAAASLFGRQFRVYSPDPAVLIGHRNGSTHVPFQRSASEPRDPSDGIAVLLAGEIHNEAELRHAHSISKDEAKSTAQLIAFLYETWGPTLLGRLIGDFSLCIYDQTSRTVTLARDPIGTHPLFYYSCARYVAWSTEIEPLIELSHAGLQLDEEYVAGFLCNTDLPDRTPYQGILKLPPGHFYTGSPSKSSLTRYWDAACLASIRMDCDADYEHQFFELFSAAVWNRLPKHGIATAELSGGLDSTSIIRMADYLIESGHTPAVSLNSISIIFDRSQTANEARFIEEVESQRRITGFHIKESEHPLFLFSCERPPALPNQKHALQSLYRTLGNYLTAAQSGAHLCGLGGDQLLFSRDLFFPAAHIPRHSSGRDLVSALRLWSRTEGSTYWQLLWDGRIAPRLPYPLRKWIDPPGTDGPPFLKRELVARVRERALSSVTAAPQASLEPVRARRLMLLADAVTIAAACRHREFIFREARFPFLDTRLIQFLLGIPMDQFYRPGQSRSLQRRALKQILPPGVSKREDKCGLDEALCRALRERHAWTDELMKDSYLAGLAGVKADALRRALELARCGVFAWSGLLPAAICLEVWIRRHAGARITPSAAVEARMRSVAHGNALSQ